MRIPPDALCRLCDPNQLPFTRTADLAPLESAVGQERAEQALRFGVGIRRDGFNLFAMSMPGAGKHTFLRTYLERRVASEPVPRDVCYVHNFERPHEPRALYLPPGRGRVLRADVKQLIEELRSVLPAAFDADEYRKSKEAIEKELERRHKEKLSTR